MHNTTAGLILLIIGGIMNGSFSLTCSSRRSRHSGYRGYRSFSRQPVGFGVAFSLRLRVDHHETTF